MSCQMPPEVEREVSRFDNIEGVGATFTCDNGECFHIELEMEDMAPPTVMDYINSRGKAVNNVAAYGDTLYFEIVVRRE